MRSSLAMTLIALMPFFSSGCAHGPRVLVISQDRLVVPLEAGQTFQAPSRGFYVPDAAMQDLMHKLAEKVPQP